MIDHNKICDGMGKVAWGYFFITVNFYLTIGGGTLHLLPDWWGYCLFLFAITLLAPVLRDIRLLRPLALFLALCAGVDWLAILVKGEALTEQIFLLSALITCVELYFSFQLLTDLGRLMERWGVSAAGLRRCRNLDVVARALLFIPIPEDRWAALQVLQILLALLAFAAGLAIMILLFSLRGKLAQVLPSNIESTPE